MAEQNQGKTIPTLDNAMEYTLLHDYVDAYRQICERKGPVFDDIKRLEPNFETNKDYDLRTIGGIMSLLLKYPNITKLGGVNRKKMEQMHRHAMTIESPFPTLDKVDAEKAKYDQNLHDNDVKTAKALADRKVTMKEVRKRHRKNGWKVFGGITLASLGVLLTAGIVGAAGLGIYGLVANAATLGAGITSGLAVGGAVLIVVGGRAIISGLGKMFSGIRDVLGNALKKRKETRLELRKERAELRKEKAQRRLVERAMAFDNEYNRERVYPGKQLFNAAEHDSGIDFDNMQSTYQPENNAEVTGDPNRTTGDPSRTTGDPSRTTGDPNRTTGDPSSTTGDPNRTTGDPSRTTGDPGRTTGDPGRSTGDPSRTTGGSVGEPSEDDEDTLDLGGGDDDSNDTNDNSNEEEFVLDKSLKTASLFNQMVDLEREQDRIEDEIKNYQATSTAVPSELSKAKASNDKKLAAYNEELSKRNVESSSKNSLARLIAERSTEDEERKYISKEDSEVLNKREGWYATSTSEELEDERLETEKELKDIDTKLEDGGQRTVVEYRNLMSKKNTLERHLANIETQQSANAAYEDFKYSEVGMQIRRSLSKASDGALKNYVEEVSDAEIITDDDIANATALSKLKAVLQPAGLKAGEQQTVVKGVNLENMAELAALPGFLIHTQAMAAEIMEDRESARSLPGDELFKARNEALKELKSAREIKIENAGEKLSAKQIEERTEARRAAIAKAEVKFEKYDSELDTRSLRAYSEVIAKGMQNQEYWDRESYTIEPIVVVDGESLESLNNKKAALVAKKETLDKKLTVKDMDGKDVVRVPSGMKFAEYEESLIARDEASKNLVAVDKAISGRKKDNEIKAENLIDEQKKNTREQQEAEQARKAALKTSEGAKEHLEEVIPKNSLLLFYMASFGKNKNDILKARQEMIDDVKKSQIKDKKDIPEEILDEAIAAVIDEYINEETDYKDNWYQIVEEAEREAQNQSDNTEPTADDDAAANKNDGNNPKKGVDNEADASTNPVNPTNEDENANETGESTDEETNDTQQAPEDIVLNNDEVAIYSDSFSHREVGMPPEIQMARVVRDQREATIEEAQNYLEALERGEIPQNIALESNPEFADILDKIRINMTSRPGYKDYNLEASYKYYDETVAKKDELEDVKNKAAEKMQSLRDMAVKDGMLSEESREQENVCPVGTTENAYKKGYPTKQEAEELIDTFKNAEIALIGINQRTNHTDKDGNAHTGTKEELEEAVEEAKSFLRGYIMQKQSEQGSSKEESNLFGRVAEKAKGVVDKVKKAGKKETVKPEETNDGSALENAGDEALTGELLSEEDYQRRYGSGQLTREQSAYLKGLEDGKKIQAADEQAKLAGKTPADEKLLSGKVSGDEKLLDGKVLGEQYLLTAGEPENKQTKVEDTEKVNGQDLLTGKVIGDQKLLKGETLDNQRPMLTAGEPKKENDAEVTIENDASVGNTEPVEVESKKESKAAKAPKAEKPSASYKFDKDGLTIDKGGKPKVIPSDKLSEIFDMIGSIRDKESIDKVFEVGKVKKSLKISPEAAAEIIEQYNKNPGYVEDIKKAVEEKRQVDQKVKEEKAAKNSSKGKDSQTQEKQEPANAKKLAEGTMIGHKAVKEADKVQAEIDAQEAARQAALKAEAKAEAERQAVAAEAARLANLDELAKEQAEREAAEAARRAQAEQEPANAKKLAEGTMIGHAAVKEADKVQTEIDAQAATRKVENEKSTREELGRQDNDANKSSRVTLAEDGKGFNFHRADAKRGEVVIAVPFEAMEKIAGQIEELDSKDWGGNAEEQKASRLAGIKNINAGVKYRDKDGNIIKNGSVNGEREFATILKGYRNKKEAILATIKEEKAKAQPKANDDEDEMGR